METKILSRSYLESLSSADLISLADDYGIDVPTDLSRRFIIGELLEVSEELAQERSSENAMRIEDDAPIATDLPESFNETQLALVLRNPVWAFVYWDIKESDMQSFSVENGFKALLLRVSFFDSEDATVPNETFDVQVEKTDREQYVLLPPGKDFVRVDLIVRTQTRGESILTYTPKYALPHGSPLLAAAFPGPEVAISKIDALSSLKELLLAHYKNHRQSFAL